jgi:hypothetical protein
LICQMRWSKNICEERESPHQIVMASMDERLCTLLNLAVYLECWGETRDEESVFMYDNGAHGDRVVRRLLKIALDSSQFKKLIDGKLGTHSVRKGPATYCARMGIGTDDIEARGRWRNAKRQVNTYIAVQLPVPDANVASCLCGPMGPIMYSVQGEYTWCTQSFLQSIAPNTAKIMTPEIAVVLAKALVYGAIQGYSTVDTAFKLMPDTLRAKILNLVRRAGGYEHDEDVPSIIVRVPIAVSGLAGQLNIVELGLDMREGVPTPQLTTVSNTAIASELAALTSTVLGVKRRLEEINSNQQNSTLELRSDIQKGFERVHATIKRISIQPVVRRAAESNEDQPNRIQTQVKLCKRPTDLFVLWHEYEHGSGGCKPARQFNALERGQVKWMYSFRLGFWQLIDTMIRRGHTSETAIDAVYAAYGAATPVSEILRSIRRDKQGGGHPNLR